MEQVTSFLELSPQKRRTLTSPITATVRSTTLSLQRTKGTKHPSFSSDFSSSKTSISLPLKLPTPQTTHQTCLATDLELVTTPLRPVTTSFTVMLAV
jgi:hypothetical protein